MALLVQFYWQHGIGAAAIASLPKVNSKEFVRKFAKHLDKSPDQLGPEQIREYFLHLVRDKKCTPNTFQLLKVLRIGGLCQLRPGNSANLETLCPNFGCDILSIDKRPRLNGVGNVRPGF